MCKEFDPAWLWDAHCQQQDKVCSENIEKLIFPTREEWLQARGKRIGGSDSSAIIGLNPYMDNVELWKIKTGLIVPEDISDEPYVKYGTKAEHLLRELFRMDYPQYEVFYEENNMFINNKYPFAHSSLDGWIRDEKGRFGIWEAKTTNILQSMQKEKWKDKMPDNYFCQMVHNIAVTEAEFGHMTALLKYEFDGQVYQQIKNYHIERLEVQDDCIYLMEKESEFWQNVKTGKQPALILPFI